MSDIHKHAVFEGLIVDDEGRPVETVYLGGEPQYVIDDAGFRRHVEASYVDGQVLAEMQSQIDQNKEAVEQGLMSMIGQADLFTKAAIDSSLDRVDQLMKNGLPVEVRQWLGMMGFRIVVNMHGNVVKIEGGGILGGG